VLFRLSALMSAPEFISWFTPSLFELSLLLFPDVFSTRSELPLSDFSAPLLSSLFGLRLVPVLSRLFAPFPNQIYVPSLSRHFLEYVYRYLSAFFVKGRYLNLFGCLEFVSRYVSAYFVPGRFLHFPGWEYFYLLL